MPTRPVAAPGAGTSAAAETHRHPRRVPAIAVPPQHRREESDNDSRRQPHDQRVAVAEGDQADRQADGAADRQTQQ
jgi:hypothetical protein